LRQKSKWKSRSSAPSDDTETPDGAEPPSEEQAALDQEKILRRARTKALELLAAREMTSHQFNEKMRQRGFEPEVVETTLAAMLELGLIDDRRCAELLIQKYLRAASSRMVIRQKLMQRGLPRDLIDELMLALPDELELENARRQSARLGARGREKAIASLQRKGFRTTEARRAVAEIPLVRPENEDL
jgi:regulatory protein